MTVGFRNMRITCNSGEEEKNANGGRLDNLEEDENGSQVISTFPTNV